MGMGNHVVKMWIMVSVQDVHILMIQQFAGKSSNESATAGNFSKPPAQCNTTL